MNNVPRVLAFALLVSLSAGAGCRSAPQRASPAADQPIRVGTAKAIAPSTGPTELAATAPAPAAATQWRSPFMFREAALPEGFPPPGPLDQVIVKQYPPYRAARVEADDAGEQDRMFNTLFDHIKRNELAMTAPVEMGMSGDRVGADPGANPSRPASMAFLYRRPTLGATGSDGPVEVVDRPAVTVASIAVRGNYDRKAFDRGLPKLRQWLAEHADAYRPAGPPRFLGYNSPFVPSFWKLGELQIPVEPVR